MDNKKLISIGYSEMGEWWLSDEPQKKQIGMLTIGDDGRITLSLYGNLDKEGDLGVLFNLTPNAVTAIHGELRSGDNVLLSDCFCIGGGRWIANILLKGKGLHLLENIDAYSFKKVEATYNGLEEWVGWRFWPKRESYKPIEDGRMTLSENLVLQRREHISYSLDDCTMEISYRWNFSHKDSNLTGMDYIAFSYEKGKTYRDIERRLNMFGDFLLLCLGIPVLVDKVVMKADVDGASDIQVYANRRTNSPNRKVDLHRILSHGQLQDNFQAIANKWFEMNIVEETRDAVAVYTESYESDTVLEIAFLILFQACEGLVKRLEPGKLGNRPSARSVLKHVIQAVRTCLPKAICDDKTLNNFTKKANDTRNYWIHNSGEIKKSNIFGKELLAINTMLRYALRIYLLQHTGIKAEILSTILRYQMIIGSGLIAELEMILKVLNADSKDE